ncbi:biotin [Paenibacillus swuensis]|uniref:Bifunctional ligase/repressor BirA n=1 Tax=Paenibacillus swuensis TaxID=1178515 RepID=A0A172TLN5_9BACL|nr:biotin--[acetyl-CoA-carboxylase] ligase [Paenibacillus swuensis]ANE47940.1 biotin [Paenibacillus swuensis]
MSLSILDILREHPEEFVSGEYISERMHCSRTAVWKHIRKLKAQGYEFEAIPRLGYRLKSAPPKLNMQTLLTDLNTRVLGKQIKLLDVVDSTQRVAHEWVKEGAPEGAMVIAEGQTAGRGRMGRTWHSPQGKGVWMSLVLKPSVPLHLTPQLTLLSAVALCRAIKAVAPVDAGIKWPNDILIGGRKVAGILLESSAEDERLQYVVAGIGVSVNLTSTDYPQELREIATSLRIAGGETVDRAVLIRTFLQQLEYLYELYTEEGFAPIKSLWEALNVTLGHPVSISGATGVVEGVAMEIDDLGALLIKDNSGKRVKVYSGDVQITGNLPGQPGPGAK